MAWLRTSSDGEPPADPVGEVVAASLTELLAGSTVELRYARVGAAPPVVAHTAAITVSAGGAAAVPVPPAAAAATATVSGGGPPGWEITLVLRLAQRVIPIMGAGSTALAELLDVVPGAALRAAARFRPLVADQSDRPLPAPLRRALRDSMAAEILSCYLAARVGGAPATGLVTDTVEFLIELSGTRVESHDLTHGVLISDLLGDEPRLRFDYPADIRAAKRAPLLFDGQRSVLVVDAEGRARTELQRHRLDRLVSDESPSCSAADDSMESGTLVSEATRLAGGLGFFLRTDRSIWTYVDGQPLLVRRGEHWTAFPLELSASVARMIGGGAAAATVVQAAFVISAQPRGAILAIVDDAADLDGIVPMKDRYDLRDQADPLGMRPETRLHHLIDADDFDERTLVRLAALDGATILDRDGRLLAYGAIVTSADSQHEGARTAAAKTLSAWAMVVLKVSVDGDITIFREGRAVTTLLGRAQS